MAVGEVHLAIVIRTTRASSATTLALKRDMFEIEFKMYGIILFMFKGDLFYKIKFYTN